MIPFFIHITAISGVAGYLLLNIVCFHRLWKPVLPSIFLALIIRHRLALCLLATVLPVAVSFGSLWIGNDIGVSFTSFHRGTIVGNGVFPAMTFAVILAIWMLAIIGTYLQKFLHVNMKIVSFGIWTGPIYGALIAGWVIPLFFILCLSNVFGYHTLDWNESQRHLHGVNFYFFLNAVIQQSAYNSLIVHVCFYAGLIAVHCFPKTVVPDDPERYVRRFSLGNFTATVITITLILWLLYLQLDFFPSIYEANMRSIGRALESYRREHETLPPAFTVDVDGKPLHSWRVLILPYLRIDEERGKFYETIRLDESWNSDFNRQFHFSAPEVFQAPERYKKRNWVKRRTLCDYSVIVGPDSLFTEDGSQSPQEATNTETTVLLFERETPVSWMDPTGEMNETNLRRYEKSESDKGFRVLFIDGHIERWILRK